MSDQTMDRWCEVCTSILFNKNGFFTTCGHVFCKQCFVEPNVCPVCSQSDGFAATSLANVPTHLHQLFSDGSVAQISEFQKAHYKRVAAKAIADKKEQQAVILNLERKVVHLSKQLQEKEQHYINYSSMHHSTPGTGRHKHGIQDPDVDVSRQHDRSPGLYQRKSMVSPGGIISTPIMTPISRNGSRAASPGPSRLTTPSTPQPHGRTFQQDSGVLSRSQPRQPTPFGSSQQRSSNGFQSPMFTGTGVYRGASATPNMTACSPINHSGQMSNSALVQQRFGTSKPPSTPLLSSNHKGPGAPGLKRISNMGTPTLRPLGSTSNTSHSALGGAQSLKSRLGDDAAKRQRQK